MSVIVAIKEKGVVYMGADSQTTAGVRRRMGLNETAFKIVRLENGILVGFCGRVAAKQEILGMEEVFSLNADGKLDKSHIVREIVPKLVDKMQLIGDEECGSLDVSLLLAHKDKMYKVTSNLNVISFNELTATGAGMDYTFWHLSKQEQLPARERILNALIASAKRTESVGGPYVLIDTEKLEYEVIDMGGKNY